MHIKKIKLDHQFFDDVKNGAKKAEFRYNDRDYRVGDIIALVENFGYEATDPREIYVEITHVVYGGAYGIPVGYCMFSFELIEVKEGDLDAVI